MAWVKKLKLPLVLGVLLLGSLFFPSEFIDPWGLVNLQKISKLLFALSFIQALSLLAIHYFGARAGTLLGGFLGGLISSTATTVTLASQSSQNPLLVKTAKLTFLCATFAMFVEAFGIVLLGTQQTHWVLATIFSVPMASVLLMIVFCSKNLAKHESSKSQPDLEIKSLLKLALFIFVVLSLSKVLQNLLGQYGLAILTFLVSLFEIHGSLIGNIQLHDSNTIDVKFLGVLVTISILASYVSKYFIVFTLGPNDLKMSTFKITLVLLVSLFCSFLIFINSL
jgi:uncharacterized membrane protein (DUF4010 family)